MIEGEITRIRRARRILLDAAKMLERHEDSIRSGSDAEILATNAVRELKRAIAMIETGETGDDSPAAWS